MIQPGLEVAGRCFHDYCGMEAFRLHPLEGRGVEVVYQAQRVFAFWADVDVPPWLFWYLSQATDFSSVALSQVLGSISGSFAFPSTAGL